MINKFSSTGKLILAEKLDEIDFGIHNKQRATFDSVTNFLNGVYESPTPYLKLFVKNITDNRSYFNIGVLEKDIDSDDIYDWMLYCENDELPFQLGKQLFEWGEKEIDFYMEHLEQLNLQVNETAEALGRYGQRKQSSQF